MPRIPESEIERIKRETDLAALVRSRGVELKKHGRKDLIGKCPFHADKNPSFVVTPDKNLFHCLGCDAAGSVIDLVMKLDKLEFREAVDKLLAASPHIRRATTPEKTTPAIPPEKAAQLLERVVAIYQKTFADEIEGRAYLERRGITDAGLFTQHQVGYSHGRLKEILPSDGPVWDELKAAGILLENGTERFAGCVVFPVRDVDGNLVTLYGRHTGSSVPGSRFTVGKATETENSKCQRHFFLPDRPTGLWNASVIKTYAEIILVESVSDALSVMMAGHYNVVSIQGTNGFSDQDLALLRAHGVRGVTLLLDGDESGRKATERLSSRLSADRGQKLAQRLAGSASGGGFAVRVVRLPEGEDPNGCLQARGAADLAARIEAATADQGQALAFQPPGAGIGAALSCGVRRYEVRGLEKGPHKLKVTVRAEQSGKLHVDTLDLYSARSRRLLGMDLCRIFEETPETIEGDLTKLLAHCEAMPEQRSEVSEQKSAPEMALTPEDRAQAEAFGKAPELIETILADFVLGGLIGEEANKLLGYLAMTSRKRETPLSVLVLSSSGAGKTALQDAVLSFCPPEDLVKLTALSGKALFYKERLSLKHKALALEEGDGAEEASYAIRNLISAGELTSESTIKDPASGRLITMSNKVEGPCPVFLTTTKPDVDLETKSRFWVTSVDESREQTRRIQNFQRQAQLSDGLLSTAEQEAVLKKHRNFQRLLKPLAVKNPYAAQLTYGDDRLQGRRDQPKYLNLIKTIAFLRQMRKEVKRFTVSAATDSTVEYIEVDKEDIRLANKLAHELLGHSLDEMSRPSRDLLAHLAEMAKGKSEQLKKESPDREPSRANFSFSRRDIREFTGWTNTRLHIHLKELVEFEYVILEALRNGMPYRYRLLYDGQGQDGKRFMLGLKDVEDLKQP